MNKILDEIKNNLYIKEILKKLYVCKNNKNKEIEILYMISIYMLQNGINKQQIELIRYGYEIISKISFTYKEFDGLYYISRCFGMYPLENLIRNQTSIKINKISELQSEIFCLDATYENIIYTDKQITSMNRILQHKNNYHATYIAPTSYGKSNLIDRDINKNKYNNIIIITPTIALINETVNRMRKTINDYNICFLPEQYLNNSKNLFILTQERCLELVMHYAIEIDALYVDEAHNMFYTNHRSILLTRIISKIYLDNPNLKLIYLSPLIENSNNLLMFPTENIDANIIPLSMKTNEIYYLRKSKNQIYLPIYSEWEDIQYDINDEIKKHKKNYIYVNNPVDIEEFTKDFIKNLINIDIDTEILQIIKSLQYHVHPDYLQIEALKKGVIYIHGKTPANIRNYLLNKFVKNKKIKYIISNKCLLEGININIDGLFITSVTKNFSSKNLNNLFGRVNRLNQIFIEKNLSKLRSNIYFFDYKTTPNWDKLEKKIQESINFQDNVKNPLLLNNRADKKEKQKVTKEQQILEESDSLKKYFVYLGVNRWYRNFDKIYEKIKNQLKRSEDSIWIKIYKIFFESIDEEDISSKKIRRFKDKSKMEEQEEKTKNIFRGLKKYIEYCLKKQKVYVGKSNYTKLFNSTNSNYISMNDKNLKPCDKINIAITSYDLEKEFIEEYINKFVKILFFAELITKEEYNLFIFNTNEEIEIDLIKLGVSRMAINIMKDQNILQNIKIVSNKISLTEELTKFLENQDDLIKWEILKFVEE